MATNLKVLGLAVLVLAPMSAFADTDFSIGIGPVYPQVPYVVQAPPVVEYSPPPVYYAPPPVYYGPPPPDSYGRDPYYRDEHEWREQGHYERHDHDEDEGDDD